MVARTWNVLPAEMKFSVVELLNTKDTAAFAKASREAYALSIPTMFADIKLNSSEALRSFLINVPAAHCRYVQNLHVELSTSAHVAQITHALSELLSRCVRVQDLTLRISGSLKPTIIPCFTNLRALTKFSITNTAQEDTSPLSERLVVSIAASIPNLSHLTLDRITRSAMHAPELLGSYPFVPIVLGDDDIPAHPLLGFDLSLPSLLQIPTLRALRILDSHLGDVEWANVIPRCNLEVLELGSSCYESPEFNRVCAERILLNVGRSLSELSLGSPLSSTLTRSANFKRLRKLLITPVFPLECLVETLSAVSDSPIEQLSIECHEDDTEDMCDVLEDFLSQCVESQEKLFYNHLMDVSLSTVNEVQEDPSHTPKIYSPLEGGVHGGTAAAIQRVQEYLRDVRSSQKTAGLQSPPSSYCSQSPLCAALRR